MSTFLSLSPKDLIKILESKGFFLKRIHRSHHFYVNSLNGKITVVSIHNKDLTKGTLHTILKHAGIDKDGV